MKLLSREEVLKIVSCLVSENKTLRDLWVEDNLDGEISYIVKLSRWLFSDYSDSSFKYIVCMCYASSYFVEGELTCLPCKRGYISSIFAADEVRQIINRFVSFPQKGFVVFKRVDDSYVEIPFEVKCGKGRCFHYSFEKGSTAFVKVDDEEYKCSFKPYNKENGIQKEIEKI